MLFHFSLDHNSLILARVCLKVVRLETAFLSLLLNDLMGLDNNKKSQGSESSYTLVAGGASASGEGNQMAEKTRIQTSFFK